MSISIYVIILGSDGFSVSLTILFFVDFFIFLDCKYFKN